MSGSAPDDIDALVPRTCIRIQSAGVFGSGVAGHSAFFFASLGQVGPGKPARDSRSSR
jgi:hypothetical protein